MTEDKVLRLANDARKMEDPAATAATPSPSPFCCCCWQVGNPSVNIFLFLLRSKFAKFVACFLGDNETRIKHFTCVCQRLRPLGSCLSTHSVSLTLSHCLSLYLSLISHKLCRHRLQSGKRDGLYAYFAVYRPTHYAGPAK